MYALSAGLNFHDPLNECLIYCAARSEERTVYLLGELHAAGATERRRRSAFPKQQVDVD